MRTIFLAAGMAVTVAASAAPAAPAATATPAAPAAPAPAAATTVVQTRDVPANQFMQGRLSVDIPVNIPVPVEYAQSRVKKIGYSYWMRPADAATATADNLPTRNGYMYGSTATVVTYDPRYKVFYGIDDPGSLSQLKTAATDVKVQQFKEGKYPAVMVSMISRSTGKPAYFMYMATGAKKEVFFLSMQAPDGRPDIGAAVWAKLAANMK